MLRPGQTFNLEGTTWRIVHVSDLCATCRACKAKVVTVTDKHGKARTFTAQSTRYIHISPGTPLEVLAEFEQKGKL